MYNLVKPKNKQIIIVSHENQDKKLIYRKGIRPSGKKYEYLKPMYRSHHTYFSTSYLFQFYITLWNKQGKRVEE